jgi:DNA-binding NarL/FixJ family response regulator
VSGTLSPSWERNAAAAPPPSATVELATYWRPSWVNRRERDAEPAAPRVLVADAELLFRRGLRQLLETHGVDVVGETGEGYGLVRLAAELRPDVIVVSSDKTGIDGVMATRTLKRARVGAAVLMLIASETETDVIAGILAGAAGYVLKDVAVEHLIAAVAALMRGESYIGPRLGAVLVERVRRDYHEHPDPVSGEQRLTRREAEVLRMLAHGSENDEIAKELLLSQATVKRHVSAILEKLDVRNRTQAAVYAAKRGLD